MSNMINDQIIDQIIDEVESLDKVEVMNQLNTANLLKVSAFTGGPFNNDIVEYARSVLIDQKWEELPDYV